MKIFFLIIYKQNNKRNKKKRNKNIFALFRFILQPHSLSIELHGILYVSVSVFLRTEIVDGARALTTCIHDFFFS